MNKLFNNFKSNFNAEPEVDEQGDIVQTLLIIAIFVVIVVSVGALLSNAIKNRSNATGKLIENSGTKTW